MKILTIVSPNRDIEQIPQIKGYVKHIELSPKKAYDIYVDSDIDFTSDRYDFCIQDATESRRKKLLLSDMDSTVIEQECLDEISRKAGIYEVVQAITARAMAGEIEFTEALRQRLLLLKGLDDRVLQEVFENNITYSKGAKTLVNTMAASGARAVLVSGGFTFFTNRIGKHLGFTYDVANTLGIENGKLTGTTFGEVINGESKLVELKKHCLELGISQDDAACVGDGSNDAAMIANCGLGVGYHPHQITRKVSKAIIEKTDLTTLLYFQGYSESEFL
jgi:phosphoserine phosphatase